MGGEWPDGDLPPSDVGVEVDLPPPPEEGGDGEPYGGASASFRPFFAAPRRLCHRPPPSAMRPPAGNGSAAASPPVLAALVTEDPAPSLPAGDGWHLVIPRRIWRRLDQGPSLPTRRQEPARRRDPRPVPTDLVGHAAEQ